MSLPPPQGWCFIDEEGPDLFLQKSAEINGEAAARYFLKNLRK